MSYRQTTTYQKVKAQAKRRVPCVRCGKKVTRSCTFEHTVNPWNRNAGGLPKTYAEVLAGVQAAAEAWQPHHPLCKACADKALQP